MLSLQPSPVVSLLAGHGQAPAGAASPVSALLSGSYAEKRAGRGLVLLLSGPAARGSLGPRHPDPAVPPMGPTAGFCSSSQWYRAGSRPLFRSLRG